MSFNYSVNLAGLAVSDGTYTRLPQGVYAVKVDKVSEYVKQGTDSKSIQFDLTVTDGPNKGVTTKAFIGTDFAKKGNQISLKLALLSVGIKNEVLEQGPVKFNDKTFEGKSAFITVDPREDDPAKDNIRFATKARFDASARTTGASSSSSAVGASVIPQPDVGGLMDGISL